MRIMRRVILFIMLLILGVAMATGDTLGFFKLSSEPLENNFETGTVKVEIHQKTSEEIRIENLGNSLAYVRVMLVPMWSDGSLSVDNVELQLNTLDWVMGADGYLYYKSDLMGGEITSSVLKGVKVNGLEPIYEGETLTVNILAEGVQKANKGWVDVWGMDSLPFDPDDDWTR